MDNFPSLFEKIKKLFNENISLKKENTLLKYQLSQLEQLFIYEKDKEWKIMKNYDAFTHKYVERISGVNDCKERCIKMGYGGFTLCDGVGHLFNHSPEECFDNAISTKTKEYQKINPGIASFKNVELYIINDEYTDSGNTSDSGGINSNL